MKSSKKVIVIGSGPAGEGAAMKAAKDGAEVTLIERHSRVGGACTHVGTIPSKVLRQAVHSLVRFRNHPLFGPAARKIQVQWPDLLQLSQRVIESQVRMRQGFYDRNRVEVVHGHARFLDPHTLEVEDQDGGKTRHTATHVVLATGSRPYHPKGVHFCDRVRDSDSILSLQTTPKSITIYGAGVIGCEYASIFRDLGVKVNLVNTRDRLLSFLDDEITDALGYQLRDHGVLIRHGEQIAEIDVQEECVVLELESGKRLRSDLLLWANGRSGNTQDLGLENTGAEANARGHLTVDHCYRTSEPHIYAVGDVIGFPALASAGYDQGRFAAGHITTGKLESELVAQIPTGIYTSPEISSLGPTERELTEQRVPYEVGHALFRNLARAQIAGETQGMLKLLFHRETLELLSIHCFGYQASEILHIGQAIMSQPPPHNTLRYFVHTTFNYPTMAEAYRVAALNGLNRVDMNSLRPPAPAGDSAS
ncbi:MAG: Si-specific NAD(P)(+) transhydrogenase [Deltaproteobacteria bacterium]|nr:Si-specific NAD(P)(+) transhydrogenase [Deltaproteobacteria bacterium]